MRILIGMTAWLFVLGAILMLAWGYTGVTQATFGVWTVGVACLFGIFARIAQAENNHRDLVNALDSYYGTDDQADEDADYEDEDDNDEDAEARTILTELAEQERVPAADLAAIALQRFVDDVREGRYKITKDPDTYKVRR